MAGVSQTRTESDQSRGRKRWRLLRLFDF